MLSVARILSSNGKWLKAEGKVMNEDTTHERKIMKGKLRGEQVKAV